MPTIEEINAKYRDKPGSMVWVCPQCNQQYWYDPDQTTMDRGARYCGECAPDPPTFEKPKFVVICGSSRFVEEMAVCAWLIEKTEESIVMGLHLLPAWYSYRTPIPNHLAEHEGVSDRMDQLHLRKIDIADEVFIVNVDDYIGDSTTAEIKYAQDRGKTIRWFTHDEIGYTTMAILKRALLHVQDERGSNDSTS